MNHKDMREKLKGVVESIPRSNEDMVKLYNETFPDDQVEVTPTVSEVIKNNVYTYIGQGDKPPHMIKFMGKQVFVRGDPVEVTDPEVLAKVKINPCFTNDKVDKEKLYEQDEIEAQKVEEQRNKDIETQLWADRNNKKLG